MHKSLCVPAIIGLLLLTGQVAAQTATDVACNGCVGTSDLATNSVTTGRILDGSIRNADFGDNSVTSGKIRDGNVNLVDLSANVQGFPGAAIANISTLGVYAASGGGAGASCTSDRIPISANCSCVNEGGARNFGVLQACFVVGSGAVAGCFPEALTFDPNLPNPLAEVTVLCLGAESYDGTPWVPTQTGLGAGDISSDPSSDRSIADAARWHAEQHASYEAGLLEMQNKIADFKSRVRQ